MKRGLLAAFALLAAVAGISALWFLPDLRARARVGQGYVAKQLCSCVFVAGRDLAACRADLPADADLIQAEASADGVRAWLALLGERRARFTPEHGCTLDAE